MLSRRQFLSGQHSCVCQQQDDKSVEVQSHQVKSRDISAFDELNPPQGVNIILDPELQDKTMRELKALHEKDPNRFLWQETSEREFLGVQGQNSPQEGVQRSSSDLPPSSSLSSEHREKKVAETVASRREEKQNRKRYSNRDFLYMSIPSTVLAAAVGGLVGWMIGRREKMIFLNDLERDSRSSYNQYGYDDEL